MKKLWGDETFSFKMMKKLVLATDFSSLVTYIHFVTHFIASISLTRGPGNHRLRVGGFNSKFVSKLLINLLRSPTWLIKLLVSRERNRHHNSRLIRGALIVLRWHQTSVWKQVDLPEPVGTDRKRPPLYHGTKKDKT